jgi:hypothetical protein
MGLICPPRQLQQKSSAPKDGEQIMAKTTTPSPQQGSTPAPSQQQGQSGSPSQQQGQQPVFRDWASI